MFMCLFRRRRKSKRGRDNVPEPPQNQLTGGSDNTSARTEEGTDAVYNSLHFHQNDEHEYGSIP